MFPDNARVDPFGEQALQSPFSGIFRNQVDLLQAEVQDYLLQSSNVLAANFNTPLDYWREKHVQYPKIAALAKRILPIVGSSASERIFRLIRTEIKDRGNIYTETVSYSVNMKTIKKFKEH